MKNLFILLTFFSAGIVFADHLDPRERYFIYPKKIVASSKNAQNLCAPKFGQVSEGEFLKGSGVILDKNDWIILDFGKEIAGSIQIGSGARTSRTAAVRVRFGESVSETMSELIGKAKNATATNEHAIRDDIVTIPWFGRREIGETGFRFVRIDNPSNNRVQIEYVRAVSMMRPMKKLGSFECSDERINKIFETAVHTVHLCCQDFVWDGIKRDRLVWMGDMHPETHTILNIFGASKIIPETLDYAAATTHPKYNWMNTIPNYTLWWIRNVADWYRYSGDKEYIKKHENYIARTTLRILSTISPEGRWKAKPFLDWPTEGNKNAAAAGTQGLLLITLNDAKFLLEQIDSKKNNNLIAKIKDARKRVQKYQVKYIGSKTAAALLGLAGINQPSEMYEKFLSKDGHKGVSTFYGYYILEAMSAAGQNAHALKTVRDYWGGMLDMGATSFWEDFDLAWTNNAFRIDQMPVKGMKDIHGDYGAYCYKGFRHSLCHGWSGGPAPWCINNILGIRPLDIGCKTVQVKPDLAGLKWAKGSMALPCGGAVKVEVKQLPDGKLDVSIDAPKHVKIVR
jgi:hypothetical protein